MKTTTRITQICLALLLLTAGWTAQAAEPQKAEKAEKAEKSSVKPDQPPFESFGILTMRNIFDPRRQSNQRPAEAPPTTPTLAAPPLDRIALEGVLLNQKVAVAFFEGTMPEYNKTLRLGEEIAGHKLAAIHTDRVVLVSGEQKKVLPLAGHLNHQVNGNWEVTTDTTPVYSSPPTSNTSETKEAKGTGGTGETKETSSRRRGTDSEDHKPATAPSGGAQDDMLKKLMEKRRKEMGQ